MNTKLHSRDAAALKNNRCYVEHVNGFLRRFRSVNTKFVKRQDTYNLYVEIAILCLNLYVLFGGKDFDNE
jgi:hypothetical protein